MSSVATPTTPTAGAWQILVTFLKLGFTSFGGPAAHLGFFREEFVERKKWLADEAYSSLVALCQFLPGPASSQVGMLIGFQRGGYLGAFSAWLGFTLPSAAIMIAAALGVTQLTQGGLVGVIAGLKVVAVVVVAHAVLGMGRTLCTGVPELIVMAAAAAVILLTTGAWVQILVITCAAAIGVLWFRRTEPGHTAVDVPALPHRRLWIWLPTFALVFIALIAGTAITGNPLIAGTELFYRAGSLVFGGGHVVLPLLAAETVDTGLVDSSDFLAGYATAQALPGPLFAFAAFLGAAGAAEPGGVLGGIVALVAIFLPGMLLALGVYPVWAQLAKHRLARAAAAGINASVVGILLAALYDPVFTSAITGTLPAALMVVLAVMLMGAKLPPWAVVLTGAVAGGVLL